MKVEVNYRVLRAVMYLIKYWDKPLNGYDSGRECLIALAKGTWKAGDYHIESSILYPGSDPIEAINKIVSYSENYPPFVSACMQMTEGICNDVIVAEYQEDGGEITEENVVSAVIEVAKGYGGKDGWFDIENLFNLHIRDIKKIHRDVVAYDLCKKLVPQLTKEEFEDAQKKLLDIAAKTPKYKIRKKVNVSFNDRTFMAEIESVEWLPGRGWSYDILPLIGGWQIIRWDHIPEGNISDIAE